MTCSAKSAKMFLIVFPALFIAGVPSISANASHPLGIEITLPGGESLYVPVFENEETVGVVRVDGKQISGVRFIPHAAGTAAKIEVAALQTTDKDLGSADYREMLRWPSRPLASLTGKEGDVFQVPHRSGDLVLPQLMLKIVAAHPSPVPGMKAPFFVAGPMKGSPPKGACMQLGQLAVCCWGDKQSGSAGIAAVPHRGVPERPGA